MSRVRPYLQLVRFPTVFTALADILLGALALGVPGRHWFVVVLLGLASACLYWGGMVWNDFFDLEQDKRERPFRPIPSGRVSRAAAGWFGGGLLLAGGMFAITACWLLASLGSESYPSRSPVLVAATLMAAILLYDAWLKRTWAGPIAMGTCRFLNVLLGLSVAGTPFEGWHWHLAAVVGLYIVGVTWFARKEAGASDPVGLTSASVVMLASLFLALALPLRFAPGETSPLFPYLLVVLGFVVGIPVCQAVGDPVPKRVQAAVKRSLQGLVLLDAVLATALAGPIGLAILGLLVPIFLLNRQRWLYLT